ncbi:MAG: DUF4131 domain-containing protein, partial [bacterium]
ALSGIGFSFLSICRSNIARWFGIFGWGVLGVSYGLWHGHSLIADQLPESHNRVDVMVSGVVTGLPKINGNRARFYFRTDDFQHPLVKGQG